MWARDFRVACTLAKVDFEYCKKNPIQTSKKPDIKPAKPAEINNLSLIEYMAQKGLISLPENLDEVLRPIIARGHLKDERR